MIRKAFLVVFLLAGCCSAPSIDVGSYRYMQQDPVEAVRFFQLAVELGAWKEAAACLTRAEEQVGSWELWIASGMSVPELGDLSLNQIIVGTYFIKEVERRTDSAVVAVLSHPLEDVDQRYDLVLVRRSNRWLIDLDRTVELNMQPPQ